MNTTESRVRTTTIFPEGSEQGRIIIEILGNPEIVEGVVEEIVEHPERILNLEDDVFSPQVLYRSSGKICVELERDKDYFPYHSTDELLNKIQICFLVLH